MCLSGHLCLLIRTIRIIPFKIIVHLNFYFTSTTHLSPNLPKAPCFYQPLTGTPFCSSIWDLLLLLEHRNSPLSSLLFLNDYSGDANSAKASPVSPSSNVSFSMGPPLIIIFKIERFPWVPAFVYIPSCFTFSKGLIK